MGLKILNEEYFILSADRGSFPECYHGSTIMLYLPQRDVIVLNDDSPVLNDLEGLISEYLSLNDIQRKMCMEEVVKHSQKVIEIVRFINKVTRTRRKLYHNMKK